MTKIVLVGAGILQFGTGMLGDIFTNSVLKVAEIVLNDINEAAALRTLKAEQDFVVNNNLDFTISVVSDLRNGLKDADFVVIQWRLETALPYGIWIGTFRNNMASGKFMEKPAGLVGYSKAYASFHQSLKSAKRLWMLRQTRLCSTIPTQ